MYRTTKYSNKNVTKNWSSCHQTHLSLQHSLVGYSHLNESGQIEWQHQPHLQCKPVIQSKAVLRKSPLYRNFFIFSFKTFNAVICQCTFFNNGQNQIGKLKQKVTRIVRFHNRPKSITWFMLPITIQQKDTTSAQQFWAIGRALISFSVLQEPVAAKSKISNIYISYIINAKR